MENLVFANASHGAEVPTNFSTYNLAENRVQALKSLVELVLYELNSLQKMTSTKLDIDEDNISLPEEVEELEIRLIRQALIQTQGHRAQCRQIIRNKNHYLAFKDEEIRY